MRRAAWVLTDPATWRDLRWLLAAPVPTRPPDSKGQVGFQLASALRPLLTLLGAILLTKARAGSERVQVPLPHNQPAVLPVLVASGAAARESRLNNVEQPYSLRAMRC
jgi:hypothetical protein